MSGDFGVMGRSRPHHQGGSSLRCGYTVYWREKSGGFAAREYVLYALNVHVGFVFLLLLSLFVSISGTLILHPDFLPGWLWIVGTVFHVFLQGIHGG